MILPPEAAQCSKCDAVAEYGHITEGMMQWYCAEHRPAQNYADQRLPKASESKQAPINGELKRKLAQHAKAIRAAGKRTIENIIEVGRHLVEVKKLCAHGQWLPWLDSEFGWTDRMALNFMRVHELSLKSETVSDWSLPMRTLYLLAAPSTPPEAREEVFDRVESGEKISYEQVKDTLAKHKTPTPETVTGRDGKQYPAERSQTSKPYADPNYSPLPVQQDLLDQGKHVVGQMNWSTKFRFVQWLNAVYEK